MVSNYQRKSNRHTWTEADMSNAIKAIQEKRMGWLKASKYFNVPQATLRRRTTNKNKYATGTAKIMGTKTSLPIEAENEVVEHILQLESRLFGVTATELRKLAYYLAVRKNYPHKFNTTIKCAGWDWLKGFRSRHPEISFRTPEPTSAARARGFNRPQVQKFFRLISEAMETENIPNSRIYNMDESALTTVHKPPKVFAKKGKKQGGSITSGERGLHVTVVACMNSAGRYISPALIFPRKNYKAEYFDGSPPDTLGLYYETGYMVSELFVKWLDHFIKHVKPAREEKVILILDGHGSHKSLDALLKAKQNGIILICLPPHSTHRLQPLDVAFFEPLEIFYNFESALWMKNNPGITISLYQISTLFCSAYTKAATMGNAISGFKNTGISPLNLDIFPDHLYAPCEVTDNEKCFENQTTEQSEIQNMDSQPEEENFQNINVDLQSTSTCKENVIENGSSIKNCLNLISPIPSADETTFEKRSKRKSEGTAVWTKTPYVEEIKQKETNKFIKLQRKSARAVKRNVFQSSSSIIMSDEDDIEEPYQDKESDEDASCLYCNDTYRRSKAGESWIRCQKCKSWCHNDCAGIPLRQKKFVCELCL